MSALLTNESGFHGVVHPPRLHCSPRSLCLTSEPVVMILVWVFLVGCVSSAFQYTFIFAIPASHHDHFIPAGHDMSFIYFTCFYAFMALMMSFYPITGYMADVCCGRYRMVSISLVFIWIALILAIAGAVVSSHAHDHHSPLHVLEVVLLALATLIVIPGLSGFYSNVTQLGLDQLQDSPSHTLGVFLHWCVWVNLLGGTAIHTAFVFVLCLENGPYFNNALQQIGYYTPGIPFILLSIFLVLNYFTRRWFVATNAQYNPYKIVVNILRYVRTHKHPTRHSALHWTNGERPSRFDFAKVCYGGPFTSSQVEDVKTFGRIVLMLLTIGPVFILNVPTSYYLFPIFSFHVDGRHTNNCSANWIFVDSGTMSYLVGLVCLPILMWVIYCVLKNKIPKILTRLEIGIVMSILGVLSMLLIELAGHYFSTSKESNQCIFIETYTNTKYYTLEFPWYILIVPNCLNVFSYNLVLATTFEFISAQTPQPMKGLVFGVLFAIKGGFNFLGAVFLVPFSLKIVTNLSSRYISCGFGYFFVTLIVSLIGLILFVCASKRYKYRVRDEEPFPQCVVEEIYERRLQYNDESLESPDIVPGDVESIAGNHGDSVRDTQQQNSVRFAKRSEDSVICEERVGSEGAGSLLSMSHDWYGTFQYSDSERQK